MRAAHSTDPSSATAERHAQAIVAGILDSDDVVQEEGQWLGRIELLSRCMSVRFERFHRGCAIEAYKARAVHLRHAHACARRDPSMRNADADGLVRKNLERDDGIIERLRPRKDIRLLEPTVITGTAAEKLVVATRDHRQRFDDRIRVAGKRVAHDERGAVWANASSETSECGDHVRSCLPGILLESAADADRELHRLGTHRERRNVALAARAVRKLARGRRADDDLGSGGFREHGQQLPVVVLRRCEGDDRVRRRASEAFTDPTAQLGAGLRAVFRAADDGNGFNHGSSDVSKRPYLQKNGRSCGDSPGLKQVPRHV